MLANYKSIIAYFEHSDAEFAGNPENAEDLIAAIDACFKMNDLAQKPENVNIFTLLDLKDHIGIQIIDKYQNNQDKLRWALKPIFLKHLLNETNAVIYVDNDIYFYNDFVHCLYK